MEWAQEQKWSRKNLKEAKAALFPPFTPILASELINFMFAELHRGSEYFVGMAGAIFKCLNKHHFRTEMKYTLDRDFDKYSFMIPYFEKVLSDKKS